MYTVDYLHLKTEALKPKKKNYWEQLKKEITLHVCNVSLIHCMETQHYPLTREENEAETHF